MPLIKVKVDISELKNEVTQIYNESFEGTRCTNDNERRDLLNRLIEKLRHLKAKLDAE